MQQIGRRHQIAGLGDAREFFFGAPIEREPSAFAAEKPRAGSADAVGGPGDEDDLIGEAGATLGNRHAIIITMSTLIPLFPLQLVVFRELRFRSISLRNGTKRW